MILQSIIRFIQIHEFIFSFVFHEAVAEDYIEIVNGKFLVVAAEFVKKSLWGVGGAISIRLLISLNRLVCDMVHI